MPHTHVDAFDAGENLLCHAGAQRGLPEHAIALSQSMAVTQRFTSGWICLFRQTLILKQSIGRGDDVLDFGAVLGLLESEGIDENALMGMVPTAPFNSARARPADATALRMAVVSKRAGGKTLRSGSMGLRNV